MTTELSDVTPPAREWTTADLDSLPEGHRRYELIDGVLIVSPSPTRVHQTIAMRLGVLLEKGCPPEFDVTQGIEVRISDRQSLTPDVLAITTDAAMRNPSKVTPAETLLVVEIVSPSSITMDRITKPALYGSAGVPFYWRIETLDRLAVHTYQLDHDAGVYMGTGSYEETVKVVEPWPIEFDVRKLVPRHYRPDTTHT